MSNPIEKLSKLGMKERALLAEKLRQAQTSSSVNNATASNRDAGNAIAVVGMACRFPGGATTPDRYWDLLVHGKSGVRRLPIDRFDIDDYYSPDPEKSGGILSDRGAFIEDVTDFDASFFGISPREARRMDPQHRLLLEVAWEALENAGLAREAAAEGANLAKETLGGVFVGLMGNDYFATAQDCLEDIDAYVSTGTHYSFAANRISFHLDLKGPSMAIDSACSSSLVALHQACQNLRARECDFAIAGGVNLILTPALSISYSKWGMLSPDGNCKTFDARANGFVRGEGAGVVVLKRLVDAEADGDPILAVVRGSAVNQDGATSVITAPSGLAQRAVIKRALHMSGIDAGSIGYVETHGTGTSLGDPIEVEALGDIYGVTSGSAGVTNGSAPAKKECVLGAVKTNIGHLEGAAGIAGFMKAVLVVSRGQIPPNLNFSKLNPLIRLDGTRLALATAARPWNEEPADRVAAVSSFGAGGTNAHVILHGYSAPARATAAARDCLSDSSSSNDAARPGVAAAVAPAVSTVALSAKSERSLRKQAEQLRSWLRRPGGESTSLEDLSFTTLRRRTHFEHRLGLAAASAPELAEALDAFLLDRADARWSGGRGPLAAARPVFVFAGQGSLWPAMGRELMAAEPRFAAEVREIDATFAPLAGWSIAELLSAEESVAAARMAETSVAQPCLFALQLGLVACLREHGITPAAVAGHSVGEIAAACTAGLIDRERAVALVFHRARLMQRLTGRGKMVAVGLSRAEAQARFPEGGAVAIAAVNGPRSVVLAGEPAALEEAVAPLRAQQTFVKYLPVDYAFHSPQVDELLGELRAAIDEIFGSGAVMAKPLLPMMSTSMASGRARPVSAGVEHAIYWTQNVRATVSFDLAIEALLDARHDTFLEIGPHPVLSTDLRQTFTAREARAQAVATLRRDSSTVKSLGAVPAALYAAGVAPQHLPGPQRGEVLALPNYAWDRQRHWQGQTGSATKSWSYDLAWDEVASPRRAATSAQPWRVIGAMSGLAGVLIELLRAAGDVVAHTTVDALLGGPALPEGCRVIYVAPERSPDEPAGPGLADCARAEASCAELLRLVTTLEQTAPASGCQVWVVTRGAQAVAAGDPVEPFAAPLWGLGRVLTLEAPHAMGGLVDAPPPCQRETATAIAELLAAIREPNGEDQLAVRSGKRYGLRLRRRAESRGVSTQRWELDDRALYLVTGGTRGLGLRTAQRMVERGARHLALLSKRPLPPRAQWATLDEKDPAAESVRALLELEQRGATLRLYAADSADEAAMRAVFAELAAAPLPLRGVVHAAGVSREVPAARVDGALLAETLAPKVAGGWLLHQLSRPHPLDFFLCFSSAASIWGSAGLAPYAAANEFLNALAAHRRHQELPATALCWGIWDAPGMATEHMRSTWSRLGVQPMDPQRAMGYLEEHLVGETTCATVADVQWAQFRPIYELKRARPLLAAMEEVRPVVKNGRGAGEATSGAAGEPSAPSLLVELGKLPVERRRDRMLRQLRDLAATVLGASSGNEINPEQGLFSMGFDSLTSVELTGRLNRLVGKSYAPTMLLDRANLKQICDFVLTDCFAVTKDATAPLPPSGGDDELDALLAFVESVDDAEADRLLAADHRR